MREIEAAARDFVHALRRAENADGREALSAIIEVEEAQHRLICACGPCFVCDHGTCPYGPTEPGYRRYIEDTKPL